MSKKITLESGTIVEISDESYEALEKGVNGTLLSKNITTETDEDSSFEMYFDGNYIASVEILDAKEMFDDPKKRRIKLVDTNYSNLPEGFKITSKEDSCGDICLYLERE